MALLRRAKRLRESNGSVLSDRKIRNILLQNDIELRERAIAHAHRIGDDWNRSRYEHIDAKRMTPAERTDLCAYLGIQD